MTTERRTGGWHEAWATRPARPRDGRMIAGVAAGLGRRYDVDPVLMRIAFVVTALYGPGIPLYLIACGLLPDGGRAGRGRAGLVLSWLLVGAGVIGFWILLGTTNGGWFLPLVVTLALLVALHVTRGNRHPPAGTPTTPVPGPPGPAAGTPGPGTPATGAPSTGALPISAPSTSAPSTSAPSTGSATTSALATGSPASATPPTDPATGHTPADPAPPDRPWTADAPTTTIPASTDTPTTDDPTTDDPVTGRTPDGATGAGLAADAPTGTPGPGPRPDETETTRATSAETQTPHWTDATVPITPVPPSSGATPAAPPARPRTRSSRITPLTLTCALLAAGVVGVLGLSVPGSVDPTLVPATALAVVGVGLVVGAFRHAGRWLLPFALLLVCVTWVVAAVPWAEMDGGVGMVADAPRTAGAVLPEYRRGVGDVALDLSRVDLSAPPGTPPRTVRTAARVGVGSITVRVPRNADLVVHGDTGLGEVYVNGQRRSGDDVTLDVTDTGPDGPGGGRVELTLHAAMGSVAVNRV